MPNSSGLAPVVSATGITAGTFAQWFAYFVSQYQAIYGSDAVLTNDSQDGQFIGVISKALADCGAGSIAVYNSFSPATAQGTGLSNNVQINGLKRLVPSNSTAPCTIVGGANQTVTNGQAIDANQNIWLLPSPVTFPGSGSLNVTVTAQEAGAITAPTGAINAINTPVFGWQSITNTAAATPGAPVETDPALRVRQANSVSLPALTIFESIVANIENLVGVTRVKGYENNTSTANANGIPANTLYFLVEGGTQSAIFNAIFEKITPGIPTMGSITETITDANGSTRLLKFDLPTDATITTAITVLPRAGWSTVTIPLIQAALVNYYETLAISSNISYLGIPSIALLPGTPQFGTFSLTALTIKKNALTPVSADIQLNFNEAAVAATNNVTVTVAS
jgi:uncharacterized phage protein gp47/JayE